MKPKPQPGDAFELFQSHFDQLLNPDHELVLIVPGVYSILLVDKGLTN